MHKFGDVILGGIFEMNFFTAFSELYFTSEPNDPICHGFDILGFRQAQTMAFAVDEINRNSKLLPNISLGYSLYDSCSKLGISSRAALSMTSGRGGPFQLNESCYGYPPVLAIVGDSSSTRTIAISSIVSLYRLPMVSYFATCSCLSDKRQFPSFFRTIPSDAFQVRAMLQILRRFGWTWVGLLISDDDYGRHAARSFQSDLAQSGGGCLAYLEVLPQGNDEEELQRIVGIMKKSTSRVVIVFAHESNMLNLMEEVVKQNVTGLQWMASEAWSAAKVLHTPSYMPFLAGTLGIAIRRGEVPGLRDFLLTIRPDNETLGSQDSTIVKQFWENVFQCKFTSSHGELLDGSTSERICTGNEVLRNIETEFLDLSNLRPEYNVYKAVYALAHALQDMLKCVPGRGPFKGQGCANLKRIAPWQLLYYLERVNFTTTFGDQVSFDENGDALPIYDVMNWMWHPDGSTEVKNMGEVKELASKDDHLILDAEKIFWNFESKKPPWSVCSESCPPGTRMARKKGEPVCCFDCIPCSEGKVSNETDSTECFNCPEDYWSNPKHDHCIPKSMEFLSYVEPLGISLTTASLSGALLCTVVIGVFTYHRTTPVVRANNSELSFLILLSLKLCFLCSLLFIGQPRLWTSFIPAYINSPGKYADAVEVFAILASSFGLLLALFGPKCFIILLKPEKNTKKALMGRGTPRS
ncbi:unnamed protein product [Boreogadus saida]